MYAYTAKIQSIKYTNTHTEREKEGMRSAKEMGGKWENGKWIIDPIDISHNHAAVCLFYHSYERAYFLYTFGTFLDIDTEPTNGYREYIGKLNDFSARKWFILASAFCSYILHEYYIESTMLLAHMSINSLLVITHLKKCCHIEFDCEKKKKKKVTWRECLSGVCACFC